MAELTDKPMSAKSARAITKTQLEILNERVREYVESISGNIEYQCSRGFFTYTTSQMSYLSETHRDAVIKIFTDAGYEVSLGVL